MTARGTLRGDGVNDLAPNAPGARGTTKPAVESITSTSKVGVRRVGRSNQGRPAASESVPAIARWLEWLPRDAAEWAFIEATDSSEEIALDPPENVEVQWLHRGAAEPGTSDILEKDDCDISGYRKKGVTDFDEGHKH